MNAVVVTSRVEVVVKSSLTELMVILLELVSLMFDLSQEMLGGGTALAEHSKVTERANVTFLS